MMTQWWHPGTWTVRTRILLTILIVAAFGMVATGAVTFLAQREQVLEQIDHRLNATVKEVQYVAKNIADSDANIPGTSGDSNAGAGADAGADAGANSGNSSTQLTLVQQVLRSSLQRIIPDHNESVLGIVGGKAALVSGATVSFALQDDKAFVARIVAEVQGNEVMRGTARTQLGTLRYVAIPINDASSSEKGIFVSAYNLDDEMASIAHSLRIFMIAALGTLIVIGCVGSFVAGRLLRPVRQLQQTAAAISAIDLTQRIPVRGTDDLSNMAATVNDMLERIAQGMDDQRQLLDDVRHELRTPLTIVRGHLELMNTEDVKDVQQTRELVIDELDRMNTLVSDIALLSESSSTSRVGIARHEIDDFAQSVLEKVVALSTERIWEADFSALGQAEFDAERITQAWLQLAENAVKYSPPQTVITLGTRLIEPTNPDNVRRWTFFVRDQGIGIAASMRDSVFERFHRVGQTRGVDGSGLGLSIVQAIANIHGGTATITPAPGGGATGNGTAVNVTLPVEQASIPALTTGDQS